MKATSHGFFRFAYPSLLLVALTACSGGGDNNNGGDGGGGGATYTVGGTVAGLAGSGLVLQNNAGGDLAVSAPGEFTFATELADGAAYAVSVMTQPSAPAQHCVVTNGDGTVGMADITNVAVDCTTLTTYNVSGTVTGLTGSGLELKYSDTIISVVPIAVSDGAFVFTVDSIEGSNYQVVSETQPSSPTQNCVVIDGTGTLGTADVTGISIVCSEVGRFAYVANAADDTISEFSIDSTTGALTAVGTVATGTSPFAITGSPDRRHVYVVNQVSNNISEFAVNATSGALTAIPGSPVAAGTDPQALAFDPSGAYLYVANNGSNDLSAYAVNASTGALAPLPIATYATGTGPTAVSVDSTGKFVFVVNNGGSDDISAFAITTGTGELTPVAGSPFDAGGIPPVGMVFVDSAGLYGLFVTTFDIFLGSGLVTFSADHDTGALTALRSPAVTVDHYIATDRNGGCLYVTTGGDVVGYAILDTDLFTVSGFPIPAGTNAYSVTVDPSNQFLYVGNDGAGTVSGYVISESAHDSDPRHCELIAIPGSPFTAGSQPDFVAIL